MGNLYKNIINGLNEALDYSEGKIKRKTTEIIIEPIKYFKPKEIKNLREKLSLSQNMFAVLLGVNKKTVEAWEYGINKPNGSALRILALLKKNPENIRLLGLKKAVMI